MNFFDKPRTWTTYEGASQICVSEKIDSKIVEYCIQLTKITLETMKNEQKSKILGEIRVQLNEKYGKEWQAFCIPQKGNQALDIMNYNLISTYNDNMYVFFIYKDVIYFFFQTQPEKENEDIEPIPQKINTKQFESNKLTNIKADPMITEEMLKHAVDLILKNSKNYQNVQSNETLAAIQQGMNEKFNKEWQIITFKNMTQWAFWIISEKQDRMCIQCDYYNQRFVLFKTPEEKED